MRGPIRVATLLTLLLVPAIVISSPRPVTTALLPVYLSYADRSVVPSPDGKWDIVVAGPQRSLMAWLSLRLSANPEVVYPKWPLQRGAWVLWRPDSSAFALTDAQFANHYFIDVFSTTFRMRGPVLGSPITSLSSSIEHAFAGLAAKQYSGHKYDTPVFYPKAVRWLGHDRLLVILSARTNESTAKLGPAPGVKDWHLGFVLDVARARVVSVLSAGDVRLRYGIDLAMEQW